MHRLTGETITDPVAGNYSASYQYDAVGNRVYSIIDGVHTSYSVDANDRLLSEGETHYSYDANGSLIQEVQGADETRYSYNARNLLAEVIKDTAAGVSVAGYRYNPDGIRTSQSIDGASTQLLVDSNRDYAQVVAEVDATGAAEGEYVHGLDLLSQHRAGVRRDYLADGLGSVRGLSQGATVVDDYRYDAWGNQLYRSGSSANPYLYSGEWYDSALDQYYLRARTYAPQSGRFVQMDSWMGVSCKPSTLNKYTYTENEPSNATDPSGNMSLISFSVANNISSSLIRVTGQRALRRAFSRVGCELGMALADEAITYGIYILFDGSSFYVGQSNDIDRRQREHLREAKAEIQKRWKSNMRIIARFTTDGGKDALRVMEQYVMDVLRLDDNELRNSVDAINKKRGRLRTQYREFFKKACK